MTDRFDAQLRQHLLETANERPAEGQLAAVVDRVAVTPQRPPFAARLTWLPGRVGPIGSNQLRWGLVALALVGATVAGALMIPGSARPSTVFEGTWTSIDSGDGSTQFLVVGAGTSPAIRFIDEHATGLACRADVVKVFTADGLGTVDGNRLTVLWPEGGGCGLVLLPMDRGVYAHADATDVLVDPTGLAWTRVADEVPPPTRGPLPDPTQAPTAGPTQEPGPDPTEAPSSPVGTPDLGCVDIDAPGSYSAPAGSMTLTVAIAGTPGMRWMGQRDNFNLLQASCGDTDGRGWMAAAEVTLISTDACVGTGLAVDSAAAAVAAVSAANGIDLLEANEVTVGGYPGTRLDLIVRPGFIGCPDGQVGLVEGLSPFGPELNFTLYFVDVEGKVLGIALYAQNDWTIELREAVNEIIATMQVEPGAPSV
jgi:hypothetical protein